MFLWRLFNIHGSIKSSWKDKGIHERDDMCFEGDSTNPSKQISMEDMATVKA